MIVAMKKITFVCLASGRDQSLDQLQRLGVVHVAAIAEPQPGPVEETRRHLEHLQTACATLHPFDDGKIKRSGDIPEPPDTLLDEINSQLACKRMLLETLHTLSIKEEALKPYGNFDPALIRQLEDNGIQVRFYHVGTRDACEAPPGVLMRQVHHDTTGRHLILAGAGDFSFAGTPLPIPDESLACIQDEIAKIKTHLTATDAIIAEFARYLPALQEQERRAKDDLRFYEVRESMGTTDHISYLQGFCPVPRLPEIQKAAMLNKWGLLITDPDPDESVPTLIENPKWIQPIRVMFNLIGIVPGYHEVDISMVFLLFYSLFFAMLVGDVGYGLVFLGLTFLIRMKFKQKAADATALLTVLSVATIIWGLLTGSFFGIHTLPTLMAKCRIQWLTEERNVMQLCFLIGAIHLSIAHLWNAVRTINSPAFLAQLGWVGTTWSMYFLAANLILEKSMPTELLPLFIVSVLLIVLFMTPWRQMKTEWPNHIMLPLSIVGNFGDVVSYVRLFAVGSAGVAITMAFNEMAFGNGIHSFEQGLTAALILFAAHSLNIALSMLGVIVHGVRLNTLEFSSHLGMNWTGFKYHPFARSTARMASTDGSGKTKETNGGNIC